MINKTLQGSVTIRSVATGWTGVDISTPLLPEGVSEIDADPLSLDGRCGGGGR